MLFKSVLICIFISSIFTACSSVKSPEKIKQEIFAVEKDFSLHSSENGYRNAFAAFSADNAIHLNSGKTATIGKAAIIKEAEDDSSQHQVSLTWKPLHAEVSVSADMAAVLGDWTLITKSASGSDTIIYGNYITVWKKQASGEWKFIMDGGTNTNGPTDTGLLKLLK